MEHQVNDKAKESVWVRGIAATIQAMAMPTFENLKEILGRFGYTLRKNN